MQTYVSIINPASQALAFIDKRIDDNNYRGLESSQHNRYDLDEVITTLRLLAQYTPNNLLLRIRTEDLRKRPYNLPEEAEYANFCHAVNQGANKGTQDSIRKNLFVDWHRMGLIHRYNKHKIANAPFSRSVTYYVNLTDLGRQLIKPNLSKINQQFLFAKALDNLLGGFISDTLSLLSEPEIKYIDFNEFMLFVTAINAPNYGINVAECLALILDFRRLSKFERQAVIDTLSTKLKPNLFTGNKTAKRDFHNWQNKNQQIWHLFKNVAFFDIDDNIKPERLYSVSLKPNMTVYDKKHMKRSNTVKLEYFQRHQVQKTLGFEPDHIIPLMTANNIQEYAYLDDWRNLLYIDAKTHAVKSQSGSKFCRINYDLNQPSLIWLLDYQANKLFIEQNRQGLFNPSLMPLIKHYNDEFWK